MTVFFLFLRWREAENDVKRERERERERERRHVLSGERFPFLYIFVFCSVYEAIATTTTTVLKNLGSARSRACAHYLERKRLIFKNLFTTLDGAVAGNEIRTHFFAYLHERGFSPLVASLFKHTSHQKKNE